MAVMAGEQKWRLWAARVAVVVAAVVVGLSLSRLWTFANQDNPAVVEDSHLAAVANSACAIMRDAASAAAVAADAPITQRIGAINAQNDAVSELVAAINRHVPRQTIETDQPAAEWLEDWGRLIRARDTYAASLAAGKPKPLTMPTIEGVTLPARLNGVGLNCRVPLVLLAP
jgi:hypothetical protein